MIKIQNRIERKLAQPNRPKKIRFKVSSSDIYYAQTAAQQLKDWNVIKDYKIIFNGSNYELIIIQR